MPNQTRVLSYPIGCRVEAHGVTGWGNTVKDALENLIRKTQNLEGLAFFGHNLNGINFQECDLRGNKFDSCNLNGCNFQNCDLRNIGFRWCKLKRADFRGATMTADCKRFLKFHHPSAIFGPPMDGDQLLLEF